jgi:hypothetical protein
VTFAVFCFNPFFADRGRRRGGVRFEDPRPYADLSAVLSDEALAESEALAKVDTRYADTLTAPPLTRPSLRCLLAEMQGSLWLRVSARCRKTL